VKTPSIDVVPAVIEAAEMGDPRLAAILMLGALAGIRRGELYALRWSDVVLCRRNRAEAVPGACAAHASPSLWPAAPVLGAMPARKGILAAGTEIAPVQPPLPGPVGRDQLRNAIPAGSAGQVESRHWVAGITRRWHHHRMVTATEPRATPPARFGSQACRAAT
jgi:hypothetical protein